MSYQISNIFVAIIVVHDKPLLFTVFAFRRASLTKGKMAVVKNTHF